MLRSKLAIPRERLQAVNDLLLDPENKLVSDLLEVVEKYGGVDEINKRAREAGKLANLMAQLKVKGSPHVEGLAWLAEQRDRGAFISVADYRRRVLGERAATISFDQSYAVTLEISSLHFFPWLIAEAKQAIEAQELMPARYIRIRHMKEQEEDYDLLAVAAAMDIIGASWCEILDTRGTDGSNVHLGGPETIAGYFGGVGQPNDYPLKWVDEYLHYYTKYGIRQVLNTNPGTILIAYLLRKLGIENEFKVSVLTGHDNPYYVLWTLVMAKLLSGDDGSTPLVGLNFSNSVTNQTIERCAEIRRAFGFEDVVRFEHHILETYKGIVRQPYDRREELPPLASKVRNLSAKHEGGDIDMEEEREHPSDILEYFLTKEEIMQRGLMDALLRNYLDKHDAVNRTARMLTEEGFAVVAATKLHR